MSNASQRRILVLGCGALGGALIERLRHCAQMTVVDPCPQVRVKEHIFKSTQALQQRSFDGLIVATKCYDIDQALKQLKKRIFVPRALFLQNGLLDMARIGRSLPEASLVRGVTTSAIGISSRRPIFHYQGKFYLAPEGDHRNGALGFFARLLSDAGLNVSVVSCSSRIVWAKLIFSAVMNPLPVITGRGYDVLKKDNKSWKLVGQAIKEGRMVARLSGIRLAFDPMGLIERVRHGDLAGIHHRGTIFQDLNTGRSTELDFITGALIRQARKTGVETPALDLILHRAHAAGA